MVNWVVVGIGDIAVRRGIPAIQAEPRSKLAGLVTRNPAKGAPYGVPCWTDLSTALVESGADAIYIATPVFLHAAQTIASLRAGKHVLCEKPMALNYAEASSMQQAAEETCCTLGVAYYRRMYPKVLRARELMEAGVIGRPVLAEATCHDWFYPSNGFRDWLVDPERAGAGPLLDIGSHRIDLLNFLFGRPLRATGQRSTLVQPILVEDNATVLVEYEGGVRGVVDVRWHSRVTRDEFRIRGTEGEIDLTPLSGSPLVYPGGREDIPAPGNLHYPCIENFTSAVLRNEAPVSSGSTALLTEWVASQVMGAAAAAV
ncbi:MAG TPA: Gfo/Idh/MocA family oxidoreductase [Bryobacteraceae bacterium]|nr:Gfo/Idh/MocA family oxidoreductase [Bryobacteraceae bacterium]